jgi:F0F1-type ATP synthase membrane subunit b/b'
LIYQHGTARARRNKDKKTAQAVWDLESEFNQAVEELVAEGYDFAEPLWDCAVDVDVD